MSNLCENAFFFCLTGVSLATIWGGRRVSWEVVQQSDPSSF